jgi:AmmeMemoRadiSam system protein A
MSFGNPFGKGPIMAWLALARQKGWKAALAGSRAAADASQSRDFSAESFPRNPGRFVIEKFDGAERKFLIDLARASLLRAVRETDLLPAEFAGLKVPAKLAEPGACFVTLTHKGKLRGCVGQLEAREPLYRAVMRNAENAATRDLRFSPVLPSEVSEIQIEISVLTEPRPICFNSPEELLTKLRPHEDGVLLKIGARGATFLPQVWDRIPDKVEFLNQLCRKAGCGSSDWKEKTATVSVYHVEAFEEREGNLA